MRLLTLLLLGSSLGAASREQLDFYEKQVRPLFATHCYSCHSVQAKPRFAGLSLDTSAGLQRGADSGPVIVPGNPDASKLIQAVKGRLPLKMPPTGKLSDEQIATLTRWVEMGAPVPEGGSAEATSPVAFDLQRRKREHWAWQPVKVVPPPSVRDARWPRQPIDNFLLATLEREGLKPAPAADRATWLRRISFDLNGLPPTVEELAAFQADSSQNADEKQVDRLLASPRFGEHWARHWMDLVRYAESHGSEGDPDTPQAWRYRDYLIRALNGDVPYNQLIREHVAGDLLAQPRRNEAEGINESLLATAHWRMVEYGFQPVDPWEDRVKWTDNQVDVLSKAFQGLTVSCARCHDHKFDAISQKDYYAVFGVLAGMRPTQSAIDFSANSMRNRAELARKKHEIRMALAERWMEAAADLPAWLQAHPQPPPGSGKAGGNAAFRLLWDLRDPAVYATWLKRGAEVPERPSPPGEFWILPTGDRLIGGLYPGGVYTNLLSARHNGVLQSPRFRIDSDYISVRMLGGNYGTGQLIVENYGVPRGGIYDLRALPTRDSMAWLRISTAFWKGFTGYLEFSTIDDATIFHSKEKVPRGSDGRSWFGVQAVYAHDSKDTPDEFTAADGADPQRRLREAIAAWKNESASEAQAAFLDSFVRNGFLPVAVDRLAEEYRSLEDAIAIPRFAPSVLQEPTQPQPLLIRGNIKNPGPAVPLRYLEALGERTYSDPMRARLELADAIASPDNPLTARVMVNRIWRCMFGAGLVRTVDNFGKLGEAPSHPELLDWLANRFVSDGWSIKRMIRLLATSQAYRMSSIGAAEAGQKDPSNRWLEHMNLRRLEAEAIRDSMLAVAGELKPQMYGPSVPTFYAHDTGRTKGDRAKGPLDGDGRRSIYLEVRRNVTNPLLEAFDAPKVSTTRGERDLTNVPAQSLALLNNPFVIQQSARWAALELGRAVPEKEHVRGMFLRAFGRTPLPEEETESAALLERLRAEHEAAPDAEPQVWRDFAHSLFDLKEFIYLP